MTSKACFKCGVVKPIIDFYSHPQMADGHLGKCKECTKLYIAARASVLSLDSKWSSKERERCRVKQAAYRANGTASKPNGETSKLWRQRNRIKHRAHNIARRAHPEQPDSCSRCGSVGEMFHRHHPDYLKPKEIVWLCPACHGKEHHKKGPIKNL